MSPPNKFLGQHFLRDRQALAKIIKSADLSKKDTVLEVGPGHGELTFELAQKAGLVLAVEKDKKLSEDLKKRFSQNKNVKIIEGDILKLYPPSNSPPFKRGGKKRGDKISPPLKKGKAKIPSFNFSPLKKGEAKIPSFNFSPLKKGEAKIPSFNFSPLKKGEYKIVANIPYYLTSRLIKNFLETPNPPKLMVLMLQKEVAERICAKPPHMSLLAVSVQVYAEPKIISYVPKRAFWPRPEVDSAITQIRHRLKLNNTDKTQMKSFFEVVRAGFSSPRKKLINNLSQKLTLPKQKISLVFEKCGLAQNARAQELSVENWRKLASILFDKNIV